MRIQKSVFIVAALLIGSNAIAEHRSANDLAVDELKACLSQTDKYAYDTHIVSFMKLDSSQKTEENITVYSSEVDRVRYIKTDNSLSFLNKHGFFKVFSTKKEVFYKQFKTDSVAQVAFATLNQTNTSKLMDSVLFKQASLQKRQEKNGLIYYGFSYDSNYMIQDLSIVINKKSKEIVSVAYSTIRQIAGTRGDEGKVFQKIHMSHYRHEAPPELQELVRGSGDLKIFMQNKYPSYKIQTL